MAELTTEDLTILDGNISIPNTELIDYLQNEFPTKTFVSVDTPVVEYNDNTYEMKSFKATTVFELSPTPTEVEDSMKEQIRELVEPFDFVMVYLFKADMITINNGTVVGGIFRGYVE